MTASPADTVTPPTARPADPPAPAEGDPRPLYVRALQQTADVMGRVTAEQLRLPTPCTEYDVEQLMRHVVMGVRRAAVIGEGGDPMAVGPADDVAPGELPAAYRQAADRAVRAWSPDERLDAMVPVPWGTIPGRGAVMSYAMEVTIHGWDLARATGQPTEMDPQIAATVLAAAHEFLPAEPRGGPHVPFASVVEVAADAGGYARLAGWLGRQP